MLKFAIVVSQFNKEYTSGLLKGAIDYLKEKKVDIVESDIFHVPGAFEIPIVAQKLARTGKYAGVICLGCIIKGETAHFEYISLATTIGIIQSMLTTEVPISFGVLTTYNDQEAFVRSQSGPGNKGVEAAAACFEVVETLNRIG